MAKTKNKIEASVSVDEEQPFVNKYVEVVKSKKEQCLERLRPIMEEELKMVRGRFRNYEDPGSLAPVFVRKYPGIPAFDQKLVDGKVYELPLYVARFLNGVDVLAKGADQKIHTCSYPVHSYVVDAGQEPMRNMDQNQQNFTGVFVEIAKRKRRYGFESMEFDSSAGESFGSSVA